MRVKQSIILTFFILLIIIPNTLAVAPPPATTLEDLKTLVTQQSTQTRVELTNYLDKKGQQIITTVETEGAVYIDQQLAKVNNQVREMLQKSLFLIFMLITTAIILGNAIWYLIKRTIEKIGRPKIAKIKDDKFSGKQGLMHEEKINEMNKNLEHHENITPEHLLSGRLAPPLPPTISQIELALAKKKELQRQLEQDKILKAKMDNRADQKKLEIDIINKKNKKMFNNTKKLEKKLEEAKKAETELKIREQILNEEKQ